jgi:hypothetical protein
VTDEGDTNASVNQVMIQSVADQLDIGCHIHLLKQAAA